MYLFPISTHTDSQEFVMVSFLQIYLNVLVLIIYFLKIHDVTLSFQLLNILKFVSICNAKIAGSPYDRVALFQSPQSILLNDHGRKH